MTNDEAIYVLKNTAWLGWDKQKEKVTEAVRMAVEALKRETSGDAIDRQAAIRIASGYCHFTNVAKELEKLPPVQPEPCSDAISRQAVIDTLCDWICGVGERCVKTHCQCIRRIEAIPSVQPEPHWIPVTERLPEPRTDVWVNSDIGQIQGYYEESVETWYASFGQGRDYLELIVNAWMPLPEPYEERRER